MNRRQQQQLQQPQSSYNGRGSTLIDRSSAHSAFKRQPNIRDVRRQLEEARFMGNLRQKAKSFSTLPRKYAFGRTYYEEPNPEAKRLPKIRYQNYVTSSDDDESANSFKNGAHNQNSCKPAGYSLKLPSTQRREVKISSFVCPA